MTKIYADWIGATGIDGYRLDTVKHADLDFWPQFTPGHRRAAAEQAGKTDFFMFGEVYSADQEIESTYVRAGRPAGHPRLLLPGRGPGLRRRRRLRRRRWPTCTPRTTSTPPATPTPTGCPPSSATTTWAGSARSSSRRRRRPATYLRRDELAHELMFLTRGQPVVYSGDEQGFTGPGGDKDARQDMFASKTARLPRRRPDRHRPHPRRRQLRHPATRCTGRSRRWAALRKAQPGAARRRAGHPVRGRRARASSRSPGSTRRTRTEYVVAANNATTAQTVTVDTSSAGATFPASTAAPRRATAGADGKLTRHRAAAVRRGAPGRHARSPRRRAAPTVTITAPAAGALGADPGRASPPRSPATRWPPSPSPRRSATGRGRCSAPRDRAPYTVYHDLTGLAGGTTRASTRRWSATARAALGSTTSAITVGTPAAAAQPGLRGRALPAPGRRLRRLGPVRLGRHRPVDVDRVARRAAVRRRGLVRPVRLGEAEAGREDRRLHRGRQGRGQGRRERPLARPDAEPRRCGSSRATRPSTRPGRRPPANPTRRRTQNTAIIHYRRADGDYDGWGLHVWDGAANPHRLGRAAAAGGDRRVRRRSSGCRWRPAATGLSYIIHNGDTKDLPDRPAARLRHRGREVWLLAGRRRPAAAGVDAGRRRPAWST